MERILIPVDHDREIVDEIERIRQRNNHLWMDVLRIALRAAPKETKSVFKRIAENDALVVKLTKELAHD